MGDRRAAPRDPALPLPGSFPISPSSHCLVGLAEGVLLLNHCFPELKAGHLQPVGPVFRIGTVSAPSGFWLKFCLLNLNA